MTVLKTGDRLRLQLDGMVYGPEAVGRHEGQVIFATGGAPGDLAEVRLTRQQGRLWRGEVVSVLESGPARREAPCPYFGPCGGCQWQHLSDAAQLAEKSRALGETLRRLGRLADVPLLDPIGMADPWAYRNTSQFAVAPDGLLGLRAFGSTNIVDIERCPISEPAVNEVLAALRFDPPLGPMRLEARHGLTGNLLVNRGERLPSKFTRRLRREGHIIGAVWFPDPTPGRRPERGPVGPDDEDDAFLDAAPVALTGLDYVEMALLGRAFRVTGGAFFQVNNRPDARPLPAELLQTAERLRLTVPDAGASQADALALAAFTALDPRPRDTIVDAYCGVGAFGILLADRVRRVIGIESSPIAASDAHYNAEFGTANIRIDLASAAEGLADLTGQVDGVILDPPRAGCGPAVVAELRRLRPRRIAYVSCDPSTLARDLAGLCAEGLYQLKWSRVVDLFPQTYHVESVTCLELTV